MNICIGNLSKDITARNLREVFEFFGQVETADVVMRHEGNASGGLGFVGMPTRSEAVLAVLGVHGRTVSGRTITAAEIRPMDPISGACRNRCRCRSEE
jgi:RNA recognition motif-containing protein